MRIFNVNSVFDSVNCVGTVACSRMLSPRGCKGARLALFCESREEGFGVGIFELSVIVNAVVLCPTAVSIAIQLGAVDVACSFTPGIPPEKVL